MGQQFLPVLITLVVAGGFSAILLGASALLGQRTRHRNAAKNEPYESGIPVLDRADKRISVNFYLVALVFVVLDVEVAFLYPWAINYRDLLAQGSNVVLWDMLAFLALLSVTYVYLWRKGVFNWGGNRRPSDTNGSGA
jgi:NADH:ubiquinone oxidoreductase subunit 3 (subunit A)